MMMSMKQMKKYMKYKQCKQRYEALPTVHEEAVWDEDPLRPFPLLPLGPDTNVNDDANDDTKVQTLLLYGHVCDVDNITERFCSVYDNDNSFKKSLFYLRFFIGSF